VVSWARQLGARAPWWGLLVAVTLMAVAMVLPAALGWDVHLLEVPPLHAEWQPRVGPGTPAAVLVGITGLFGATRAAQKWPWGRLLLGSFVLSVAWLASLATVDGWAGIGDVLNTTNEYLNTARSVTDISATLHEYIDRIPIDSPHNWPVHVAGHPPGALLFFILLVQLGLGSGLAAGWVVLLVASTTPVAVLVTVRRLGTEEAARRVAPFLVLGPAAIWLAVSADAVFGAVAAWGLCCLALSATEQRRSRVALWGLLAGLLLGSCVMMSYGLVLLAILAIGVLLVARDWRPLPWAVVAALAVVLTFAAAGFAWWEAYPVLRERYWDGVATDRPTRYWIWANLAALCFGAGPLVGASVAVVVDKVRHRTPLRAGERPVVWLVLAASASVAIADLSGMSKAEVERIWLPFVPWLLLGCALLPPQWRQRGLVLQVATALVVQHLLFTLW